MILDGTGDFFSVGNTESQYVVDNNFVSRAGSKLEGDYVWVAFLGRDFENGL